MNDLISRQAAIDALHMHLMYRMGTDSNKKRLDEWINNLPSAQGKPFNLPEIYIADGYDTIEGEDGNVGFGVYVPDENQIYVAGDVEGEIRARALLHEICHWVQAMCGRSFDEDEANEFSDIVYDALPSAQPEQSTEVQDILQFLDEHLHPIVSPEHWSVYSELHDMISMLLPTQPRKKGEWIIKDNPGTGWYRVTCSECGEDVTSTAPCIGFYPNAKVTWDYCPNCGSYNGGDE